MTKPMVMVSSFMLMVTFMKVNGSMIKHMAKANIYIVMERFTKDNGSMIDKRALELRYGLMEHDFRELLLTAKKKVQVF